MAGDSNRGRIPRWITPLGSHRCRIRDDLERIVADGPKDDREQVALDALVDFWFNEALDRTGKNLADQRLVESLS